MKKNEKALRATAVSSVVAPSACAYQSMCPDALVKHTK